MNGEKERERNRGRRRDKKTLIWVIGGGQRSVSGLEQRESEVNKLSSIPFSEEEITD